MRLVRFERAGTPTLGVLDRSGAAVVDVGWLGDDLATALRAWSPQLAERVAEAAANGPGQPVDRVRLLAPCAPLPRNVFCVGKNYADHAAEFERSGFDRGASPTAGSPSWPVVFTKATTSVIGPDDPIPDHSELTQALDYEAELAVVIGKGGRGITAQDALDHVFGYTILNDLTARDLQRNHQQWFLGKSLDGYCPVGPHVVTGDEVDLQHLEVRCWVNGELRQSASTRDLIFDVPTLIATISAGITLEPGDLIATGTPGGVGVGFDPPRFLAPGDLVTIEITGLGRLSNQVSGKS